MVDQIKPSRERLQKTFMTGKTRDVAWRKNQLNSLLRGVNAMQKQLQEACVKDLGRTLEFSLFYEIAPVKSCIYYDLANLDKWVKEESIDTEMTFAPATSTVVYEPLGVALIFGSWNYPYFVTLKPLVQAIAAGNCAVIKPSEFSPATSQAMEDLVNNYLDKDCFKVIQGGTDVAIAITQEPWDIICFTGSTQKGKLVAAAAAKNLTPCILELGGKCPTVVDVGCNMDYSTAKICMATFLNAGQTCVRPDYVLVHESLQDEFVATMNKHIARMELEGDDKNQLGRIVTEWHTGRCEDLLAKHGGKVLCGGKVNKQKKYCAPTMILNPSEDSLIMQEEIFAPILAVMTYKNFDEVITYINTKDKPLAVYYYGPRGSKNSQNLKAMTSSGAYTENESVMQTLSHYQGFGGVGGSGYGRYMGYEGFKNFSNRKGCLSRVALPVKALDTFLPPYDANKASIVSKLLDFGVFELTQNQIVKFMIIMTCIFVLLVAAYMSK